MAFPAIFQCSLELMVFVFRTQFFCAGETLNDIFQLVDIFMSSNYALNVPFKLRVTSD